MTIFPNPEICTAILKAFHRQHVPFTCCIFLTKIFLILHEANVLHYLPILYFFLTNLAQAILRKLTDKKWIIGVGRAQDKFGGTSLSLSALWWQKGGGCSRILELPLCANEGEKGNFPSPYLHMSRGKTSNPRWRILVNKTSVKMRVLLEGRSYFIDFCNRCRIEDVKVR